MEGASMSGRGIARLAGVAAGTIAALVGSGLSASAQDPPDRVIDLLPGQGCAFALHIEVRGGTQVYREFTDRNGHVVRILMAGKGSSLLFQNADDATAPSLTLKPNGSVTHIRLNPDGSSTWTTTGHNVLILFPTDVPAGPSTTLQVGRVVFTVDSNGVFTVQERSGTTTDICAELVG
jgi:hypothetical protein